MKITKTIIAICVTFFSVANVSAQQDFQGKATYFSKTTMDMDNFGRGDLSEEQKKQIAERMKSMFEKTFFLVFNKTESTYKEEEKLEAPGQGGGFRMMRSFTGGAQYKNVKENQLLKEQEFFGKQFLIKDSLPKLDWKLSGETKQIGQSCSFILCGICQLNRRVAIKQPGPATGWLVRCHH